MRPPQRRGGNAVLPMHAPPGATRFNEAPPAKGGKFGRRRSHAPQEARFNEAPPAKGGKCAGVPAAAGSVAGLQ